MHIEQQQKVVNEALGLPKNEDSTENALEAKAEIAEKQATD